MATKNLKLYESLSVAGLIGDLHERMQVIRPGISRNTVRLAFVAGGTTRLRKRILEEATRLWEQHQSAEADEIHPRLTPPEPIQARA